MSNLKKVLILATSTIIGLFLAFATMFSQFGSNISGLEGTVVYVVATLALLAPIVLAIYVVKNNKAVPAAVLVTLVLLAIYIIIRYLGALALLAPIVLAIYVVKNNKAVPAAVLVTLVLLAIIILRYGLGLA